MRKIKVTLEQLFASISIAQRGIIESRKSGNNGMRCYYESLARGYIEGHLNGAYDIQDKL